MDDFPGVYEIFGQIELQPVVRRLPGSRVTFFDGTDGSQMAFWTCHEAAVSAPQRPRNDYDEYMIVVQGCYTLIVDGRRIPPSTPERNISFQRDSLARRWRPVAGTRTIHAFGGRRAERAISDEKPTISLSDAHHN